MLDTSCVICFYLFYFNYYIMDKTNIEYFNSHLKLFVTDIKTSFPEYNDTLAEYYKDILENESCNDDKYVKRYMRKLREYKTQISKNDDSLFNDDVYILKNINFKDLWVHKELSKNNKNKIWEHIQILFVIGETIISDCDKIKNLVKNFQTLRNENDNNTINNDDSINNNTTNNDTINNDGIINNNNGTINLDGDNDEDKEMLEMLKNLSERSNLPNLDENMLNNGMIGQLAQELSNEISDELNLDMNLDETSSVDDIFSNIMSGDNPMKFMNLIQTVGQKIQNKVTSGELNQEKLVEEAKSMMGSLTGGNPLFDNILKAQQAASNAEASAAPLNPTQERLRKKLESRKKK